MKENEFEKMIKSIVSMSVYLHSPQKVKDVSDDIRLTDLMSEEEAFVVVEDCTSFFSKKFENRFQIGTLKKDYKEMTLKEVCDFFLSSIPSAAS